MAKMSFEEWKLRKEYDEYLKSQDEPSEAPAAEPEKQAEPEQAPEAAPAMGPAEDYRAELNEIREQMKKMAASLSPSLGDVQPVGIEDVVTNFFKQS